MLKKLKDQNKGFTIIEVLIVLAIAGLIMLIVFMAVPALNRNKRNTQARSEVSNYLGAVQEWSNNNNGRTPLTGNDLDGTNGVNSLANGTFMAEPPQTGATAIPSGARTTVIPLQSMELVVQARCSTTTTGQTVAAPGRALAIRFAVEGSNGAAIPQCQES